jgi:hypothetical protein
MHFLRWVSSGLDCVKPNGGRQAHEEHKKNERRENDEFANAQIGVGFRFGEAAFVAVEEALHEREHVSCAENYAECCGDGPSTTDSDEGAGEDDALADEAAQHGQADHRERRDNKVGGQAWDPGGEAAIGRNDAGGVTELERAEEQKDSSIDNTVRKNLVDGTGPASDCEAVNGKNNQAEMAECCKCQ